MSTPQFQWVEWIVSLISTTFQRNLYRSTPVGVYIRVQLLQIGICVGYNSPRRNLTIGLINPLLERGWWTYSPNRSLGIRVSVRFNPPPPRPECYWTLPSGLTKSEHLSSHLRIEVSMFVPSSQSASGMRFIGVSVWTLPLRVGI